MYMSYDLSHYLDGDISRSTSFTVSDDDAINCAHMLAAGFNTISRKMMGDFVLAVVDTKAGTVQYDGKIEKIERPDPHIMSTSFKFEASTDADTMVTTLRLARSVLEAAYNELEDVKSVLFDAGVETIPADAGVRDLLAVKRAMSEQISELKAQTVSDRIKIVEMTAHDCGSNAGILYRDAKAVDARAELIEHVKRAYAKWGEVDPGRQRESLKAHLRGMLEVLSKFLVAIGEAAADERHAVALRVCEIPEGNYLYDDA